LKFTDVSEVGTASTTALLETIRTFEMSVYFKEATSQKAVIFILAAVRT
jgi:hypothetical protein